MAYAVFFDEESLEVMDAAAQMAAAALSARANRFDDDGVLKRSVQMSVIKLEQVRRSIQSSPLAGWGDLSESDQAKFVKLCTAMATTEGESEKRAIHQSIQAIVFQSSGRPGFLSRKGQGKDGGLPEP